MNHYVTDWLAACTESKKTNYCYTKNMEAFADFVERHNYDFSGIVEAWRKAKRSGIDTRETFLDDWNDIVRSFHTHIKGRYAPLTVKNLLVTPKSFFAFWDIPIKVFLPKRACVIYHNRDLSKNEVKQILAFASPRDRVMWLVMAESGMRAGAAVHLKYWQIREDFEKARTPMCIQLPSSSLKDHVGDRWTFIGEDALKELKEYLARRIPLKDDEYVFESERPRRVRGDQFTVASLSVKFSRIVSKLNMAEERAGKPKRVRMHSLRKFFRNNMRADSAYIKFWMGHSLSVDAHYISRDLEKHRAEYAGGYRFLRVVNSSLESLADLSDELRKRDQEIKRLKEQVEKLKAERLTPKQIEQLQHLLKLVKDGKVSIRT